MSCVHLRKLYQLCETEGLKLGGSDLVRIVCRQCGVQDVCPSMLIEELDSASPGPDEAARRSSGDASEEIADDEDEDERRSAGRGGAPDKPR